MLVYQRVLTLSLSLYTMQDDTLMLLELTMLTSIPWPPLNQGRHAAPKVSSNLEDQRSSARSYTLQIVVPPSLPDLIVILGLCNRRTRFKMSLQE